MPAKEAGTNRKGSLSAVNKELWLLLSIFVLAAVSYNLLASQQVFLGLFTLPTLFSAFYCGRRHAVMTSLCSVLLVVLINYAHPLTGGAVSMGSGLRGQKWFDLMAWGGILMIIGYTMGSLCERVSRHVEEQRNSYEGMTALLEQIVNDSRFWQNSRLAMCAAKLAETMGLPLQRVDDIRSAALLSELEKTGIGSDLFRKAAGLEGVSAHDLGNYVDHATGQGSTIARAIPILLALEEVKAGRMTDNLPMEVQVLVLANMYESGSQEKGLSPLQVIEKITTQKYFDAPVVEGFKHAFV